MTNYKKYICIIIWHKFTNYKKTKEDKLLEYREGKCYFCEKKDIYINSVYD
jgi:hypothetical protein